MDCSSFSSSSVKERDLCCDTELARDISGGRQQLCGDSRLRHRIIQRPRGLCVLSASISLRVATNWSRYAFNAALCADSIKDYLRARAQGRSWAAVRGLVEDVLGIRWRGQVPGLLWPALAAIAQPQVMTPCPTASYKVHIPILNLVPSTTNPPPFPPPYF